MSYVIRKTGNTYEDVWLVTTVSVTKAKEHKYVIEDSEVKIKVCLFLCLFCFWLDVRLKSLLLGPAERERSCEWGQDMVPWKSLPVSSPLTFFSHTAPPPRFCFCTKWAMVSKSPEEMKRIRGLHPDCTFPCDLFAQCWSGDASESAWWSAYLKELFYVYVFPSVRSHVCVHRHIHVEARGQTWMFLRSHAPCF